MSTEFWQRKKKQKNKKIKKMLTQKKRYDKVSIVV